MLSTQTEVKLEKEAHAHRHCQKKKVFTKLQPVPWKKTQQLCNNRVGKTGGQLYLSLSGQHVVVTSSTFR